MGMYDTLYVNINMLPLTLDEQSLLGENCDFQTQDLDCILTEVYITNDGELKINRFEYDLVPKEERPYPNDEGFKGLAGSLRRINQRLETIPFDGTINFYTFKDKVWFEFFADFTNGKLNIITGGKE